MAAVALDARAPGADVPCVDGVGTVLGKILAERTSGRSVLQCRVA